MTTDVVDLQGTTLEKVYYFTALAHHAGADVVKRHRTFIKALESKNVQVVKGKFKRKFPRCNLCNQVYQSHEEKETDVNIALRLLECCLTDECDTVVLVTGDTDLAAAVATSKRLFPKKRIGIAFPYLRVNHELKVVADFTFQLSVRSYKHHQFPNPLLMPDGTLLYKPPGW